MINSKSSLAILLSKLKSFENPEIKAEQYTTDSEAAADVLWNAFYLGDIKGKVIADLGCGTGILGLGALLLGAKKVFFVDSDARLLDILKENSVFLEKHSGMSFNGKAFFVNKDVSDFGDRVDTVLQNPPFGTRKKHADRDFLLKSFSVSGIVYSFHKSGSDRFIDSLSGDMGFGITHLWHFNLPIKAVYDFHKKRIHRIRVGCWRLEKKNNA